MLSHTLDDQLRREVEALQLQLQATTRALQRERQLRREVLSGTGWSADVSTQPSAPSSPPSPPASIAPPDEPPSPLSPPHPAEDERQGLLWQLEQSQTASRHLAWTLAHVLGLKSAPRSPSTGSDLSCGEHPAELCIASEGSGARQVLVDGLKIRTDEQPVGHRWSCSSDLGRLHGRAHRHRSADPGPAQRAPERDRAPRGNPSARAAVSELRKTLAARRQPVANSKPRRSPDGHQTRLLSPPLLPVTTCRLGSLFETDRRLCNAGNWSCNYLTATAVSAEGVRFAQLDNAERFSHGELEELQRRGTLRFREHLTPRHLSVWKTRWRQLDQD
eukprot:TRINITY_DN43500_c0_g1_i1.p1 TRINITY_DN43500_c0_g1~~TRINITY_DN43500_c0_g1_i1.p1  ORF type:complete len:332 (+),score=43.37 TRINITY_DN43500_c0_g1_i1:68-1063(+)